MNVPCPVYTFSLDISVVRRASHLTTRILPTRMWMGCVDDDDLGHVYVRLMSKVTSCEDRCLMTLQDQST
jgi:hypothetical protein